MATLTYDFEDETIGTLPTGWGAAGGTTLWTVQNSPDTGKALSARYGFGTGQLSWTGVDAFTDGTVIAKLYIGNSNGIGRICIRMSGTFGSHDMYFAEINSAGNTFNLRSCDGGSYSVLETTSQSFSSGTWYWVRLQAIGTAIKASWGTSKAAAEASWTLETTDANIAGAGFVGVGDDPSGGSAASYFDDITLTSDDIVMGEIDVAGYDPSVLVGVNVTPGGLGGEIKIAHYDPIAKLSVHTTPGAGAVGITGYDPELGFPINVDPVGELDIAGLNPTVTATAAAVHLYVKFKDSAGNVWKREVGASPASKVSSSDAFLSSSSENLFMDATAGDRVVSMVTAVGRDGFLYSVTKTDSTANTVTLDPVGSEKINGEDSLVLSAPNESVIFTSDGSNWQVIASEKPDCPVYKYVSAAAQAEGDLHLSGASWATSKALIKQVDIGTSSTDWDLWILQNDNGYITDDATVPAIQLMDGGNGDESVWIDHPYEDEDASGEVHLYVLDNIGSTTFDIYVRGYQMK